MLAKTQLDLEKILVAMYAPANIILFEKPQEDSDSFIISELKTWATDPSLKPPTIIDKWQAKLRPTDFIPVHEITTIAQELQIATDNLKLKRRDFADKYYKERFNPKGGGLSPF